MKNEENPKALKHLISEPVVDKYLSNLGCDPSAIRAIKRELKSLELKDRVRLLSKEINRYLPGPYPKSLQKILMIVKKEKIQSFELWPVTEYIQTFGIKHPEESMEALYQLTQVFTAEFAVRPFLIQYPKAIYNQLHQWSEDPNEHIRRWTSEGTRPKLPWGEVLREAIKDPSPGLAILENLKYDPSLYVRKSVANHLNDISKDHPTQVIETLKRWQKNCPKDYLTEFSFLRSRALRTLIKNADPRALRLEGFSTKGNRVEVKNFKLTKKNIFLGESVEFEFTLLNQAEKASDLLIDYVIHYQKANGQLSAKVFKLKKIRLNAQAEAKIFKRHPMKKITTRKYHEGIHKISLLVNGQESKSVTFYFKNSNPS